MSYELLFLKTVIYAQTIIRWFCFVFKLVIYAINLGAGYIIIPAGEFRSSWCYSIRTFVTLHGILDSGVRIRDHITSTDELKGRVNFTKTYGRRVVFKSPLTLGTCTFSVSKNVPIFFALYLKPVISELRPRDVF